MSTIDTLLATFASLPVLCIGDAMLDRYLYGEVERISPEAPIPVLRAQNAEVSLGGAGNVVRNIVSLGGHAALITLTGDDDAAAILRAHVLALGAQIVHYEGVTDPSRPTSIKTRYVALRQQLLRYDEEATHPANDSIIQACLERVAGLLPIVHAVVLSDYGKGLLTPMLCQSVIALSRQRGIPVLVDPKGQDYSKYQGATYITPNRSELTLASGHPTDTDEQIEQAARRLISLHGFGGVFATRSEKGMSFVNRTDTPLHIPTEARAVFDVSGAGDTVIACLALALGAKQSIATAMTFANKAAGIVVSKKGTAIATPAEMRRAYATTTSAAETTKYMAPDDLLRQVQLWRQENLRIGFTNGCFDLLHAGHIRTLSEARQQCDRLIVAINSDASVQQLKGASRPLQSAADRCTILSALSVVDAVTIFDDTTPLALIRLLQPDILVKGGDYQADTVVGADIVRARGGRVLIVDSLPGRSTTRLASLLETHDAS